jgi:hypothetical protein
LATEHPGQPTYGALQFLVRHGDWVAPVVGLVPAAAGAAVWAAGSSPFYALAGALAGAFLYLMMRSYVELVRVIVDMLLPRND